MLTSSSCYEVRAKPLSCEFFKSDAQQDNDCCITCMCIQVITPGSSWPYSMHISQYNSGIPCLGSRRLDSSGRKKERARERRPFFLAPTISGQDIPIMWTDSGKISLQSKRSAADQEQVAGSFCRPQQGIQYLSMSSYDITQNH